MPFLVHQPESPEVGRDHHPAFALGTTALAPGRLHGQLQDAVALRTKQPSHARFVGDPRNVGENRRRELPTGREPLPGRLGEPAMNRLNERLRQPRTPVGE
jgi:hypothetical protein